MEGDDVSSENSEQTNILLGDDDYALVLRQDGSLQIFVPRADGPEGDAPVARRALALVAVANKMRDEKWVDDLIEEYFPDEREDVSPVEP